MRLAALLLLTGCSSTFKPETLVDSLRVLSITADPPEIAPGGTSNFSVVELDPSRPGGVTTVVWVGCQPDPFNLGRTACNDTTALLQPTSFSDFPPGVAIMGFGPHASYQADANLFDPVPMTDEVRQNGTVGQILAVVIGAFVKPTSDKAELRELFTKIENQEIQTVMALARVTVSEHTPRNLNPHIVSLNVNGAPLPTDGTLQLEPGQDVKLDVVALAEDREKYTLETPDGTSDFTENLVSSFYSTGGRFSLPRVDLDSTDHTVYTAPGSAKIPDDPIPAHRTGVVWAVLRDSRGGQVSDQVPFFICDDSLPKPKVVSITPPVNQGDHVVVKGTNLTSALDVVIGTAALQHGSYNQGTDSFLGDPPVLAPGTYPVTVRGKECSSADTGLTYTVP
ncbi:MAG: hypothetical protein QM723_11160 [Myxococcaceae bacterium]